MNWKRAKHYLSNSKLDISTEACCQILYHLQGATQDIKRPTQEKIVAINLNNNVTIHMIVEMKSSAIISTILAG